MKMSPVSLLLGVSVLLLSGLTVSAVSLNLSPNRFQFFSGDPVSLSCVEDGQTVDGTVKRTRGGQTEDCGPDHQDFGLFQDSSCVLDLLSSYTGVYWCETGSGRSSDKINISVFHKADVPFILEIPALPVMAGSDVTLRCRNKDGSTRAAYFFWNNKVSGGKVQEFILTRVQRSDEGLYSCSTDVSEPSPQSWLRVREPPSTTSAPPTTTLLYTPTVNSAVTAPPSPSPSPPPPVSLVRLVLHLVVFSLYCICTVLMVSICCSRRPDDKQTVYVEMTRTDEVDDVTRKDEVDDVTRRDEVDDVTRKDEVDDVTIEQDLRSAQ
uniref:Ig-like domain-containing protein n=1 Tax=Anabas testudineus TaxID=64144 RepID=A0A7N5ZUN0_ANATE